MSYKKTLNHILNFRQRIFDILAYSGILYAYIIFLYKLEINRLLEDINLPKFYLNKVVFPHYILEQTVIYYVANHRL